MTFRNRNLRKNRKNGPVKVQPHASETIYFDSVIILLSTHLKNNKTNIEVLSTTLGAFCVRSRESSTFIFFRIIRRP